jgi:hypothetical protein
LLDLPRWFNLNHREFERQFALPAVELKEIAALDATELLPEKSSIKICSHELHGPLPEIIAQVDPADRLGTFDAMRREAVKLCVISRLRRELVEAFSGASFLPPTRMDDKCVAGLQWHGRTVLTEAADFVQALRIPDHVGQGFRSKLATDSGLMLATCSGRKLATFPMTPEWVAKMAPE